MLSQNWLKQLDSQFQRKIITTIAEAKFLGEATQSNSKHKSNECPGPNVSLVAEFFDLIRRVDRQGKYKDVLWQDITKHGELECWDNGG